MKLTGSFIKMGIVKTVVLVSLAALGHSRLSSDASQAAIATVLPHVLEKRDAFTCYGVCPQLPKHYASHAQHS